MPLHPAVLELIALAASAGERAGKLVAVCGWNGRRCAAAVPILIGLGVRELSVVPAAIPHSSARCASSTSANARRSPPARSKAESAADVRALVAGTKDSSNT